MGGDFFECVDVGSENCPCYLSLTNDCMTCTRLQGMDHCDCKWAGVCIYNEFIWNKKKIKNPRNDIKVEIVDKKIYDNQFAVLVFKTDKYLSQRFKYPGTYIFMRNPNDSFIYDVPISVMYADSDKDHVHTAIKIISAKTKRLIDSEDNLIIRGPYRNGIFGLSHLKNITNGRMLILCKSMGIAPAVKIMKYYDKNLKMDLIADINRIPSSFAQDCLVDCKADINYLNFKNEYDLDTIKSLINERKYDAVAVFATDKYITLFHNILKSINYDKGFITVNNFSMCCGEGVCGACASTTKDGKVVKMCKCQMKGEDVLKGGVIHV